MAKELGVKSPAIVKKCRDEGIDVRNHMSTISAGLAATIREWFSEGQNVTTVESSKKVNLKEVRKKKKKKKKVKKAGGKTRAKETESTAKKEKLEAKAGPATSQADTSVVQEVAKKAGPRKKTKRKKKESRKKVPEQIMPAGPLLKKPKLAKVSGPQIIRVGKPEPARPSGPRITRVGKPKPARPRPKAQDKQGTEPKSRKKTRKSYDAPITEPLIPPGEQLGKDLKQKKPAKSHPHKHGGEDSGEGLQVRRKWRQKDIEERRARLDAAVGKGLRARPSRKIASKSKRVSKAVERPRYASVIEPITVKDLSAALGVKVSYIIRKLMEQGVMATANQSVTSDVAELVSLELGIELTVERRKTLVEDIAEEFANRARPKSGKRSPVATMLGHVDHGKTSLLDKIRSSHVRKGESGGITQHIGAYQINWGNKKVTFLDTPGHEAFTAMRARGANMTDIVVLVVAADDGVMPQTVEAIHHAQAADVPILVALNKIDLPGCDINRIYSQLSEHELVPVEWGGSIDVVKTSAVTDEGISDLLEHLDYSSELLELNADDTIPATGWVVEAKMSSTRGPVATLLIKEGKLSKGDVVLAGGTFGRVKSLRNSFAKDIKQAVSSTPVEITGLDDVPQAGDKFYCLDDINKAKNAAEDIQARWREESLAKRSRVTLDNLFTQIEAGKVKELNIIIRADVQGSVDVLKQYLTELNTDEVKIKILHAAPGGITESDVVLAEASNAIIIGFHVVSERKAARLAEEKGVEIRLYNVIYRITEELRKSMSGLLEPEEKEESVGQAVVRETFKISKIGTIAGCYVNEGVARRDAKVRLIRDNIIIQDNLKLESLKRFKDDVREVKSGMECGIKVFKFDDIKEGDVFAFHRIIEVAREL